VLEDAEDFHVQLAVVRLVYRIVQRYASEDGLSQNEYFVRGGLDLLDFETNLGVSSNCI
jgi:hypothetical protein